MTMFVVLLMCMLLAVTVRADEEDSRIYTIAINVGFQPFEFLSSEGVMEGFSVEIIRKICEVARKKCEFVTYVNSSDCWSNQMKRGNGLDNRYWDACGTWYATKERSLVYHHPGEFVAGAESFLYVLEGSGITTYNPNEHRTGFRRNFWTNDVCLKNNNIMGNVRHAVYFDALPAIGDALKGRLIDVGFGDERVVQDKPGFRKIAGPFLCGPGGQSIMIRKDDANHFSWWKPAVVKVIKSHFYQWLCAKTTKLYGSPVMCFKDE